MKIQYLGTAAAEGWPAVFCTCEACKKARITGGRNIRTRSQALIDDAVLLDFPPDTYLHVLRNGIALDTIETLLVTHSHQDHFYPMELLMRGEPYAHQPSAPKLTVYGNHKVEAGFLEIMRYNDSSTLVSQLAFKKAEEFVSMELPGGYCVTPLAANHAEDENCLIYMVEKAGKRLLYAHDSGNYPESTWEFLRGTYLNLVSLDCTGIQTPDGNYHMGLPDNRKARERLLQQGCADPATIFVINHFSHNGGLMQDEIEKVVEKDGFMVAYDGMIVEF